MANSPTKLALFIVWITTDKDMRDDAVTTHIELFSEICDKHGPPFAHMWSGWNAFKSIPFGGLLIIWKLFSLVWKISP